MKYKVGDILRIKEDKESVCSNFEGARNATFVKITSVEGDYYCYDILNENRKAVSNCSACFSDKYLIRSGRSRKVKPVQFVVVYDEADRDPAETFTSRKELNKWLKDARHNGDVIFDSIRVYEVKKEYEVKTSFSLKVKK